VVLVGDNQPLLTMPAPDNQEILDRLIKQCREWSHEDEVRALILVNLLMIEYAYSPEPMTEEAAQFSHDLRMLVNSWL
jgi:hypothetical protein